MTSTTCSQMVKKYKNYKHTEGGTERESTTNRAKYK